MKKFELSCFIQKEAISELRFSKSEVLPNTTAMLERKSGLTRALRLGNLLKNKVNIYFKDGEDNRMRVHTTIWGLTTDAVILKQGIVIPRNRVEFID